jgi:hypothetical protein
VQFLVESIDQIYENAQITKELTAFAYQIAEASQHGV